MTNTIGVEVPNPEGCPMNLHVAHVMSFDYGPIHCLSLNDRKNKLALFRGGDAPAIEIWDISHIPFLERVMHDLETINDKVSVESLVWAGDRLFSCGLHGFILEHDLVSRKIKKKYMATSGPVWNLSVNPDRTLIGAATEDGFVNIFEIVEDELLFQKVLDRQEGRILCLCWSPCGKYIATGSVDNVRVWDVEKRHAMQRLSTGRSKKNETIVWSVLIVDQLTVVSGDSRGMVSFWDGRLGVLMFKIFTHRADILCMSLAPDNDTIYVSGVDPAVVLVSRVGKNGDKWVRSHQRIMHTNDVLCLATVGKQLISGGVDCDLTVSIPPIGPKKRSIRKYPPLPKSPRIFLSLESKRVLVQESRGLSIWQLPSADKEIVKLIDFKSRGNQIISSSCISPSGKLFVYAAESKITCFRLVECADGKIIPVKLKKSVTSSVNERKSDDLNLDWDNLIWNIDFLTENYICAVSLDGSVLQIIQVDEHKDSFTVKPEIYLEDYINNSGVNIVAVGNNGRVAISTVSGQTYVLELSPDSTIADCAVLPGHDCPVVTIEFHPFLPYLVLTYGDHTARVYNFDTSEVVFHEHIGGPMARPEELPRRKKAKRKAPAAIMDSNEERTEDEEHAANAFKQSEECNQPIMHTTWSPDGSKLVFQETNRIHLLEIFKMHMNGLTNNEETPTVKKSRRERGTRATSASPVPVLKSEEWTSDKALLLTSKLESLSLKQRSNNSGPSDNHPALGKTIVSWKKLNCEKSYKYVACSKFLNDNSDLLVVEVQPGSLLSKLPPAFAKKRFGM